VPDWDKRYREKDAALFGNAPNEYLREILARSDFAAKSALCLADGDGRNGRWLAGLGIRVTGVDLSGVAREIAVRRDAEAGVEVERIAADLAVWEPDAARVWDAAFMIYLHCEREVRQVAVQRAGARIMPGGWFVAEGFAVSRPEGNLMGPDDTNLLYDTAELRAWLPGFQVVEALTGTLLLEEGRRHRGEAHVVRFAARRAA